MDLFFCVGPVPVACVVSLTCEADAVYCVECNVASVGGDVVGRGVPSVVDI